MRELLEFSTDHHWVNSVYGQFGWQTRHELTDRMKREPLQRGKQISRTRNLPDPCEMLIPSAADIAHVVDSMIKKISLIIAMFALLTLMPRAAASFANPPTFDVATSSNFVGATDAIYSLFLENTDQSEDAINVTIVIPAGYSIGQQFITSKSNIQAGSVSGACQIGSGTGPVMTTTTPGRFSMSAEEVTIGEITVIQPTITNPGQMAFSFSGHYAFANHGCHGSIEMAKGFFINPSTPGMYAWAPSSANPKSGSAVTMVPRSGFSQSVTIVGTVTTTTSTTDIPEFSSALQVVFVLALTLSVAVIRKK